MVVLWMGTSFSLTTAASDENPSLTGTSASAGREGKVTGDQAVDLGDVTVTGRIADESITNVPAVVESITAEGIERINAIETQDVFKYMPGSYLRKLYPGSTNSPLVIRGNNSEMTGRTLVMMDGIRLSDFTAAGHGNAPKWFMVAPREIEKVDMIYGPFSAGLSGNSMSGTAMITTHMPESLEVDTSFKYFYQNAHEYKTDDDLHGFNAFGSVGSKTKNFSYNLWFNRLETQNQSISYVTKSAADGGPAVGSAVTGWVADKDPGNQDRYVLGAAGTSEIVNNTFKVKLAYDLTDFSKVRLTSAIWDSERDEDSPETYLRDTGGNPVYTGTVNIDGKSYTLNSSTFRYRKYERQDLLNGLGYSLDSPDGLKLEATLSTYNTRDNISRQSTDPAPASRTGGAGRVTDGDEGWYTADIKAARDIEGFGFHTLAAGYHFDQYYTDSETWNASNWYKDIRTTLREASEGKTRTHALFLEDTWHVADRWSIYLGGRYEWWRGFDANKSTDGSLGRVTSDLADKSENYFSPKFSTTFSPNNDWQLRFSMALATRFPTVGELYYGGISATGVINNANPDLKPEESFARDFTITRFLGSKGEARLTFFQDDIENAIFRQTNAYTLVRNYQNVDDVRTRGVELAYNIRRFFIDGLGLFTNVAWTDSEILRNDTVPASVGKQFPRVPDWRIKCVLDYAPTDKWALTLAGHYSGDQHKELDNSDTRGGYGGVDDFLVFDAKFTYRFTAGLKAAVGVDNITDELYHVSHPYPMRTLFAEIKYTF
jgi:iron complex outermembrane receptor protein